MKRDEIDKCAPERLAELMDIGLDDPGCCRPEELSALLRHQLSVPVPFDLGGFGDKAAGEIQTFCLAEGLVLKSLGDLFAHPHPPVELLELTKRYAKACRQDPGSPLPEEIAAVLYFASVCAAFSKCRKRITELDDASLAKGIKQVLDLPWLTKALTDLLQETLDHLHPEGTAP